MYTVFLEAKFEKKVEMTTACTTLYSICLSPGLKHNVSLHHRCTTSYAAKSNGFGVLKAVVFSFDRTCLSEVTIEITKKFPDSLNGKFDDPEMVWSK